MTEILLIMDVSDLKYVINVSDGKISSYEINDFGSLNQTGSLQINIKNIDSNSADFHVSVIFDSNYVKSVEEKT